LESVHVEIELEEGVHERRQQAIEEADARVVDEQPEPRGVQQVHAVVTERI
jgi:hypothetical protein